MSYSTKDVVYFAKETFNEKLKCRELFNFQDAVFSEMQFQKFHIVSFLLKI